MTLSQLANVLSKAAVYTRDANAVKRNRVPQRVGNRIIGKAIGKAMRGRWF